MSNKVLILYAESPAANGARTLGESYASAARAAGATVRELTIADLKFSTGFPQGVRVIEPEQDLQNALTQLHWADHVVLFCTVHRDSIPAKLKSFIDRIFMPDKLFHTGADNNFSGKTARIVSVLDQASWEYWLQTKLPAYHSIKRAVFEHRGFRPVRTSTVGHLHSLENDYAKKWLGKMTEFGRKLI